jgi:NTE family protein
MTTLEQRAEIRGADLVLEGGGVLGIGLAGAVVALAGAGYVFPRVGGTSVGAIVGALTAAYQVAGVPLTRLHDDLQALDLLKLESQGPLERLTGPLGRAAALLLRSGVYRTDRLEAWLTERLAAAGVRTFGDLRIGDDAGTSLVPEQRYRLVVHVADLTRRVLVRLPWDLPHYLLPEGADAPEAERIRVIDDYSVAKAVLASATLPFFFRPQQQPTPQGACTWVDGAVLAAFPITVFDRTDGGPSRWPTFGVRLTSRPASVAPDVPVRTAAGEALDLLRTATGQWNRYLLEDEGVLNRTVWVDTTGISATDFGLGRAQQEQLYEQGRAATADFLRRDLRGTP